jgi:hypothetical protein
MFSYQLCESEAECQNGGMCVAGPTGAKICYVMPDGGFVVPDGGFRRDGGGTATDGGSSADGPTE